MLKEIFLKIWNSIRAKFFELLKIKKSPKAIAAGFAFGVFIGLMVPIGFQIMVVLLFALFLPVNKPAAIIGTFISNPFNVGILYPICYKIGAMLLHSPPLIKNLKSIPVSQYPDFLMRTVPKPFFLGCFVLASLIAPIAYVVTYFFITRYRRFRQKQKLEEE